jgi:hypothetical protein
MREWLVEQKVSDKDACGVWPVGVARFFLPLPEEVGAKAFMQSKAALNSSWANKISWLPRNVLAWWEAPDPASA